MSDSDASEAAGEIGFAQPPSWPRLWSVCVKGNGRMEAQIIAAVRVVGIVVVAESFPCNIEALDELFWTWAEVTCSAAPFGANGMFLGVSEALAESDSVDTA